MSIDLNDQGFYGENENLRKERAESAKTSELWTEEEENNFVKFLRKALAADAAIKLGIVGGAPITGGALAGGTGYGYAKTVKSMEPKDTAQSGQNAGRSKSASAMSAGAAKGTSPFGGFVDISTGKVTPANNDRSNKFGGYIDSDGNVYDQDGNIVQKGNGKKAEEDSDEYVTFTIPRANDPEYGGFAQKILDLGIATDKGLWGADGDVAFYTKQLYDQGALDANGNLKIGVPIRLRKRK